MVMAPLSSARGDLSNGVSKTGIGLKMEEIEFWEKLKNHDVINFPL
jgi:hypothetical protein